MYESPLKKGLIRFKFKYLSLVCFDRDLNSYPVGGVRHLYSIRVKLVDLRLSRKLVKFSSLMFLQSVNMISSRQVSSVKIWISIPHNCYQRDMFKTQIYGA